MREDAHRLPARVARVERDVDGLGEAPRLVLDRPPPVEGELDDLVRRRQELGEVVVEQADRPVGLDAVGRAGSCSRAASGR